MTERVSNLPVYNGDLLFVDIVTMSALFQLNILTGDCLYGMQIYISLHNVALFWFGVFQFSSLLLNASCMCVQRWSRKYYFGWNNIQLKSNIVNTTRIQIILASVTTVCIHICIINAENTEGEVKNGQSREIVL